MVLPLLAGKLVAVGAVLALAVLSNFLKWVLHRHEKPTLSVLLGILLGPLCGDLPFQRTAQPV